MDHVKGSHLIVADGAHFRGGVPLLAHLVASALAAGDQLQANAHVLVTVRFVRIFELQQAAVRQATVRVEGVATFGQAAPNVCLLLLAVGTLLRVLSISVH